MVNFNFCINEVWVYTPFLSYGFPIASSTFVWKDYPSSIEFICFSVKNPLSIFVWGYFWVSYSVLRISVSNSPTIQALCQELYVRYLQVLRQLQGSCCDSIEEDVNSGATWLAPATGRPYSTVCTFPFTTVGTLPPPPFKKLSDISRLWASNLVYSLIQHLLTALPVSWCWRRKDEKDRTCGFKTSRNLVDEEPNLRFLSPLRWQVDSLPPCLLGSLAMKNRSLWKVVLVILLLSLHLIPPWPWLWPISAQEQPLVGLTQSSLAG